MLKLMHLAISVRSLIATLIAILAAILPGTAQAKRLALIVGINDYINLDAQAQLKRAVNDAGGVARTLEEIGFSITKLENTSRSKFNADWQQFLGEIAPGDEVAFFFSGHGVEIEGQNFLVPGDIPKIAYGRVEQIKRESLSVSELLLDLRTRKPQLSLIVLDACRDHPLFPAGLKSGAKAGGLAKIDPPQGTFIMYSAGAGERVLDRLPGYDPEPNYSIYTRKLLPLLREPGLRLTELAKRVRREVNELAGAVPHLQIPAYYDGVLEDYCLAGCNQLHNYEDKVQRLLRTFIGHTATVYSSSFLNDERSILSGSRDDTFKLWDVTTGKEFHSYTSPLDPAWPIASSPDGNMVLSASQDNTLKLWDVGTSQVLRSFAGHSDEVNTIVFSPDGRFALSGGDDKMLKLWNMDTNVELRSFTGHSGAIWSVAFSPDGRFALSGSEDKTLKLWDVSEWTRAR